MADTLQAARTDAAGQSAGPGLSPGAEQPAASRLARELGELLAEHKGQNIAVLDLRPMNMWTDFFVIATVTSRTHCQGLLDHIRVYARETGAEILHSHRKTAPGDDWNLVDLGNVVVHLMSEKARAFYELERLWS